MTKIVEHGDGALAYLSVEGLALATSYDRPKIQLPEPRGYVSDHAQAIDGDWKERIRSVCQDLERKTGVEMVVVTVPTIKPFGSANEYATALYEKWGIGSTQQEHGVLVLVAVQERQAAITLGRQMLPVITPTVMNQVGHENLQPSIELGHFGEGLYLTVVALASPAQEVRVGDHREDTISKALGFWLAIFTAIVALSFFWWISRPDLRHPYRRIQKASIGAPARGILVATGEGLEEGRAGMGGNKGRPGWSPVLTERARSEGASFDVRRWGPIQAHPLGRETSELGKKDWEGAGQVPSHCLFREHRINVGVRPHYDLMTSTSSACLSQQAFLSSRPPLRVSSSSPPKTKATLGGTYLPLRALRPFRHSFPCNAPCRTTLVQASMQRSQAARHDRG